MIKYPVYNTILSRRSIRNFTEKKVEKEKIEVIMKAAMAAPSACNLEPWSFIVIDDEKILEEVKEATEQGKYNVPLIIVVLGMTTHIPWEGEGWQFDLGCASENIMLEATELGLASVCVGGFNEEKVREILNIPQEIVVSVIIEIGYPSYTMPSYTWYTEEAIHYQKYDQTKKRTMRTLEMLADDAKNGRI